MWCRDDLEHRYLTLSGDLLCYQKLFLAAEYNAQHNNTGENQRTEMSCCFAYIDHHFER
jgi:hypothetical protein